MEWARSLHLDLEVAWFSGLKISRKNPAMKNIHQLAVFCSRWGLDEVKVSKTKARSKSIPPLTLVSAA
jgi:hypothetical protein